MARDYPNVWREVDRLRSLRGNGLPAWPDWCFMPLAGAYAIVSGGRQISPERLPAVGVLSALAAWRVTQGIYRYDQTMLDALWETPVTGDIPEDVLYSLPEWCVYIETPGHDFPLAPCKGFFAHLEHDANDGRRELRIVTDIGDGRLLGALPIHLGGGLRDGIERALQEAKRQIAEHGIKLRDDEAAMLHQPTETIVKSSEAFISVLLYLCSANAEMRDRSERRLRPARPEAVKTKDGLRLFPPNEPTTWEVGYRIGATIRGAIAEQHKAKPGDGAHASPRPHIRRAHWHAFWTGEKAKPGVMRTTERKMVIKWLPPIPVNVDEELGVVPTVHRVV